MHNVQYNNYKYKYSFWFIRSHPSVEIILQKKKLWVGSDDGLVPNSVITGF